jgi:protein-S-isoprenylcysteine O-methyltransferase Ste14
MLPRYLIAVALSILWALPFIRKYAVPREKAVAKDTSARWGIILQAFSKIVLWIMPAPYVPAWRIALGILFGIVGIVAARSAIRHLDKQWRLDAALSADHQLIRTGPYAVLRHPIYAGMFAMQFAVGLLLAQWPAFAAGIVLYVAGTEIRVRSEENLLRSRFGEEFDVWARQARAYIPFVR